MVLGIHYITVAFRSLSWVAAGQGCTHTSLKRLQHPTTILFLRHFSHPIFPYNALNSCRPRKTSSCCQRIDTQRTCWSGEYTLVKVVLYARLLLEIVGTVQAAFPLSKKKCSKTSSRDNTIRVQCRSYALSLIVVHYTVLPPQEGVQEAEEKKHSFCPLSPSIWMHTRRRWRQIYARAAAATSLIRLWPLIRPAALMSWGLKGRVC